MRFDNKKVDDIFHLIIIDGHNERSQVSENQIIVKNLCVVC